MNPFQDIGLLEKATQQRVIKLFQSLDYRYLGNWHHRAGNSNIETELLRAFLEKRGTPEPLIEGALRELKKAAGDAGKSLYDRNRAVYELLRYGVKVKPEIGENFETVWTIDWKNPLNNDFAIAEEVTVVGENAAASTKRPDIVLYVNGIALGVLELKRSTVSVAEGIRQNLGNQRKEFIRNFFPTMQLVMAGNDTEGLRYGTIGTPEKYYLSWKEEAEAAAAASTREYSQGDDHPLDAALAQLCEKTRLLDLLYHFVVFDAGTKKLCRANQFFGVKAAQRAAKAREGGIIWHTQGSGKSLTMVWFAKWLRENVGGARVLLITDRTELDDQIEGVFQGVNEKIYRTSSGADLIGALNAPAPWLIGSLIHKFGGKDKGAAEKDEAEFVAQIRAALPPDFRAKGNFFVFVDECHRTQSGAMHAAMRSLLPDAVFFGFTGTPLLKADKRKSIEIFGRYVHTYKFDEAVRDGVVLDLCYEARDIDQSISSQTKIDQWFEIKTAGLTDLAKAQLKQRWGTMRKVLSSDDRLDKIVADILLDMETRDRLKSGRGNALLVSGSIFQACKFYEKFAQTDLAGKCAIVTSYQPSPSDVKGEDSGEGHTEKLRQYAIYQAMLASWFNEPSATAINRVEEFEKAVKRKFVEEPGQMKLLIVVDKLLTGFDAPSATYLYIDKQMQNHGLFQAICRVNRLDGDDKEYGYIVDYKDLFKSLKNSVHDYTSGALDGYDEEDVAGLLEDRLVKARRRLDETLEAVRALCEPVEAPRDGAAYRRYFCSAHSGEAAQLKANEPKRLALYKSVAALIRAYANIASEMKAAGYDEAARESIKGEVTFYEKLRGEIKLHSGDAIDLKLYEPAMRHLIDTYIRADESEKVSAFENQSLIQLIVERGAGAIAVLPAGIANSETAVAETIENNVRKLIIDAHPINPKYYEKMSELLDALIARRREQAINYQEYLNAIVELSQQAHDPARQSYPPDLNTAARRALYDNLGGDETLALQVDEAIRANRQHDWRGNVFKQRKIELAIRAVLRDEDAAAAIFELAKNQPDY